MIQVGKALCLMCSLYNTVKEFYTTINIACVQLMTLGSSGIFHLVSQSREVQVMTEWTLSPKLTVPRTKQTTKTWHYTCTSTRWHCLRTHGHTEKQHLLWKKSFSSDLSTSCGRFPMKSWWLSGCLTILRGSTSPGSPASRIGRGPLWGGILIRCSRTLWSLWGLCGGIWESGLDSGRG